MTARPKTARMPAPHLYQAGDDAITCVGCPLPKRNEIHDPATVAAHQHALAERQAAHAARYDPQEDQ